MCFLSRFLPCVSVAILLFGHSVQHAHAQSVYTVQIRTSGTSVPAQRCEPTRRDSQGPDSKRGTTDTLVVTLRTGNGLASVGSPGNITIYLNKKQAATLGPGDTLAQITGTGGSLSDDTLEIGTSESQGSICTAKLPTDPQAETVDPAFTLHYGIEVSSATGFAREKTSPAIGARWDIGKRTNWGPVFFSNALTTDLTQVARVREHRSCVRETRGRPLTNPFREGERVAVCAKADTVGAELFFRRERTDSLRAGVVSTWRSFLHSRVEFDAPSAGYSVGAVVGVGFQTDPGGFAAGARRIRPLYLIGPGIRQLRADGTQRFRLDLLWGSVQSYASGDRLVEFGSDRLRDTVATFTQQSLTVEDETQWQVHLDMRLFKGAHIRGFATFSAPRAQEPRPVTNPLEQQLPSTAFPDLVRIAFLLDRDIKQLWDTLVGNAGAK